MLLYKGFLCFWPNVLIHRNGRKPSLKIIGFWIGLWYDKTKNPGLHMKKIHKQKKNNKWTAAVWIIVAVIVACTAWANGTILLSSDRYIVGAQEAGDFGADCILILGARVDGNEPSQILESRLACGVDLYNREDAPKLLLTGDGGENRYDEVSVMQQYAIQSGVPEQNILLDRRGFDTYESIYRAKELYGVRRVLIVTQSYHLYRALYIARALGLEARGVAAEPQQKGQLYRDLREVVARCKDFAVCIAKLRPGQMDTVSILNNGGAGVTSG
jgi:SanA protein